MTKNLVDNDELDAILPGVSSVYEALHSKEGFGIYTSRGQFYNHTIFGRDASMSAKFAVAFDPKMALEVIHRLIALQGLEHNSKTQEAPGRIHHELRDFRRWKAPLFDHIPFWVLHKKWDIKDRQLLTYFSLDTTASFIRLVHKYSVTIDASILTTTSRNKAGETITIAAALEAATGWIMGRINTDSLMSDVRIDGFSLPVQTFQDSLYTRSDGSLIDLTGPVFYIEVQAYTADALGDMAHLFPHHAHHAVWRNASLRMHKAMLEKFCLQNGFFASAIDSHGTIDVENVSVGWILNTFSWREMSDSDREKYITPIVRRLFSEDFLTHVGLRTRAKSAIHPIAKTVDYHGSETVWPMFGFMVAEGLRRHRLHELANQLENRLINGLNAIGDFPEYHIVQRDGTFVKPSKAFFGRRIDVQMKQEKNIGFSVVPAIAMARHAFHHPPRLSQKDWQRELEQSILESIPLIARAAPEEAKYAIGDVRAYHLRRWKAGLRMGRYFWKNRSAVSKVKR